MLIALSTKNKIEFVLSNVRPPDKEKSEHAWNHKNNMVVSQIIHYVSMSIRQSIIWMSKAAEIWIDLKNKFSQGSLSRISSLQLDIATLCQDDLTIFRYFTKLRVLWDEIENFRPKPPCTCKPERGCQVLTVVKQRKQEDQVMQFLRGLNDQFTNVTTRVLLLDPILDITKLFSLLAQQERQLSNGNMIAMIKTQDTDTVIACVTSTSSTVCNYCGKYGHSEAVYYCKNGFPNQDKGFKSTPIGRKHRTHCNKTGNTVEVCYKKHDYHKLYNKHAQIQHTSAQEDNANVKDNNYDNVDDIRLTPQQFQVLAELFKNHNLNGASTSTQIHHIGSASANQPFLCNISPTLTSNYTKNNWILDSGAIDHISISLRNFSSYKRIKPIPIALPNGKMFDARDVPSIFLGFQQHIKGYQFLNLQNHKIDISRNVLFYENCFLYTSQSLNNSGSNSLSLIIPHNYSHNYDDINFPSNNVYALAATDTNVASDIVTSTNDTTSITNTVDPPLANTYNSDVSNIDEHVDTVRRSTRPKRPPTYLTDFQTNNISRYPITNFLSYDNLSSDFRSNADHSLFLKHDTCYTTTILIYFDDIVLGGNNATEIQHITSSLDILFHIKKLGDPSYFLELEVTQNSSGIHLSQHKYTLDLLTEAGMLYCAPMPTPMAHSSSLTSQGDLLNDEDVSSFRRLIGRLINLTNTKPDITFSVNNLNQFVSSPTTLHQQAAH
ncbi:uncharacterized protein LOC106778120 [Vigna radiata var. radiata]|uniref:Uncharacterized protein LOC106778120 n=1 Tax=Vigna radiata var. radiata TaxID=3916 RepID=A0A1S3VT14_VIGRR|nr:uncharacterized protein LOC106778120 [Vigna radiata var. radiata]